MLRRLSLAALLLSVLLHLLIFGVLERFPLLLPYRPPMPHPQSLPSMPPVTFGVPLPPAVVAPLHARSPRARSLGSREVGITAWQDSSGGRMGEGSTGLVKEPEMIAAADSRADARADQVTNQPNKGGEGEIPGDEGSAHLAPRAGEKSPVGQEGGMRAPQGSAGGQGVSLGSVAGGAGGRAVGGSGSLGSGPGVAKGGGQASVQGESRGVGGGGVNAPGSSGPERDRIRALRDRIEQAKRYPLLARQLGVEGTVRVRFMLSPQGQIRSLAIAESSGHDILDEAAKRTIQKAVPLPYVPGWLIIPIRYYLQAPE